MERLKILTERKSAYHVYSSMHTIESLLLGFVYCMEHLPFENYLAYMVLASGNESKIAGEGFEFQHIPKSLGK